MLFKNSCAQQGTQGFINRIQEALKMTTGYQFSLAFSAVRKGKKERETGRESERLVFGK